VTDRDILKIATDCSAASRLHPEFKWVQAVIVLPGTSDSISDRILKSAIINRVFIATTALPMRPLGLTRTREVHRRVG
jgi:hypothetical protein